MESRKIAIITDGTTPIQEMAGNIAAIIGESQGYSVTLFQAESFSGDDLLPANVFFLGCAEAKPPSFQYIEDLFKHINLAGRSCGIFSSNARALKYLSSLIRDSETAVGKPFMVKGGAANSEKLHNWIHSIFKKGDKNGLYQA
jgi:hypothetical protein